MEMGNADKMIGKIEKGFELITKVRNLWLHPRATRYGTHPHIESLNFLLLCKKAITTANNLNL